MKATTLNEGQPAVMAGKAYVVMFDDEFCEYQLVQVFEDETGLWCKYPRTGKAYRIDSRYESAAIDAIYDESCKFS